MIVKVPYEKLKNTNINLFTHLIKNCPLLLSAVFFIVNYQLLITKLVVLLPPETNNRCEQEV